VIISGENHTSGARSRSYATLQGNGFFVLLEIPVYIVQYFAQSTLHLANTAHGYIFTLQNSSLIVRAVMKWLSARTLRGKLRHFVTRDRDVTDGIRDQETLHNRDNLANIVVGIDNHAGNASRACTPM
jgi:hypothetical protein